MRFRDSYDVPPELLKEERSRPFRDFLWCWFADPSAVTHGQLDISFLLELSGTELASARELIRRNLKLKQTHIIQGAAALRDMSAVPILREMLDEESDDSRRLVLAGALWNLVRDPVFIACLERAKKKGGSLFAYGHINQVLWLDDERALEFLIDLLDQRDSLVRLQVLNLLNTLELGRRVNNPAEIVYRPDDYRNRRMDPTFRNTMVESIMSFNRKVRTGVTFGFVGNSSDQGASSIAEDCLN